MSGKDYMGLLCLFFVLMSFAGCQGTKITIGNDRHPDQKSKSVFLCLSHDIRDFPSLVVSRYYYDSFDAITYLIYCEVVKISLKR